MEIKKGQQKYHPEYRTKRFKTENDFDKWLKEKAAYKIDFSDDGQDCLYWWIDKGGEVLHAGPFQASVWNGMCVDMSALKVGENIRVVKNQRSPKITTYDFRVKKIRTI